MMRTIERRLIWSYRLPFEEDATGHYWWYKPHESELQREPQIVLVRWFRGAIRAIYMAGGQRKISEMRGEWAGPLVEPSEPVLPEDPKVEVMERCPMCGQPIWNP